MDPIETLRLSEERAAALRNAAPQGRIYLLVQHADGASVVPLTLGVALTVGRSAPAEVVIADESLSRLHAKICLTADGVVVEDLGSTNGTTFRGELVERATLRRGDAVLLGAVNIGVHGAESALDTSEIGSHERFVRWVEEEVKRARFFRRPTCVVMARPLDLAPGHDWTQRIRGLLRPVDRIGQYAQGVLEIIAPEITARELRLRLTQPGRDPNGARFVFGIAQFPDMATSPEELVGAAFAALRRATPDERVALAIDESAPIGVRGTQASPDGSPVSKSPEMQAVLSSLDRVSRAPVPVLLMGETGSGKEVLTRYLHEGSPRKKHPLVSVNCSAIPAQLVESTLFGHERGAFTGATQLSVGVFEAADGGTVFLDEIAELPAPAQAALLRVLETKRFSRVGSTKEISVDVRIVAATHRDLESMVASGAFREDLLYRLNTVTLRVPPLRERRQDIADLALELLKNAAQSQEAEVPSIDPEVMDLFESYTWPGNVRELRNVLERAVAISEGRTITVDDIPERLRALLGRGPTALPERKNTDAWVIDLDSVEGDYRARMERLEAELIRYALEQQAWNQTKTAQAMGIPLRTLVHKIKMLGVRKAK